MNCNEIKLTIEGMQLVVREPGMAGATGLIGPLSLVGSLDGKS